MSRNSKKIESELQVISTVVWQDKPYTAAKIIAASPDGTLHHAYGFSKVQYPDKWDAAFGKDLAIKKALAKIAKRIIVVSYDESYLVTV